LVRDAYLVRLDETKMKVSTLTAVERPFRSVRFEDQQHWPCRINMHPKNLKTGKFLSTTAAEEPLFGSDIVGADYELAVLWRPSGKSKGLRTASVAAVRDLDDRSLTTIFASAPLPPVEMESYWQPDVSEEHFEPADDFDDYLPGEEETGDDE
jgi:hypothetical protein